MRYSEYKKARKRKKRWIAAVIIITLLAVILAVVFGLFQLKTLEITGNERYEEQQIIDEIMSDPYAKNSLYLYLKYKYSDTEEIPFIDQVEVKMISPMKLKFHVYEKGVVGCVAYLEKYMYFDREGIVVYSSTEQEEGVTQIMGLSFSEIMLYQKLPVEDDGVFKTILDLTQNLQKNELSPDIIYITEEAEVKLYFGDVEVQLGPDRLMEEKISQLPEILPNLYGKTGVLHMESYSENSRAIIFDKQ